MADYLYIRYYKMTPIALDSLSPMGQVMWIEWKRVNKSGRATKAQENQNQWHFIERKRGALTLIAGVDFCATIEGFKDWYAHSGLMQRKIL